MTLLPPIDRDGIGDLSSAAFGRMRALVQRECGVALGSHGRALMRGRLRDRVRELGLRDYDAYADLLETGDPDRREWTEFLDRMTMHRTRFFRERAPIDHLTGEHFDDLKTNGSPRTIRGWCAACSSGQEPASIVMAFLERFEAGDGWGIRIDATDLSRRMLARAQAGVYTTREAEDLDERQRSRWASLVPGGIRLSDEVLGRIRYARRDLLDEVDLPGPELDFVFCRNAMNYFDAAGRSSLVRRLADRLRPGGLVALASAEALRESAPGLESVATALYRRRG